jgi:hypothetical protein
MIITKTSLSIILLVTLMGCSEVNDDINVDLNQQFAISGVFGIDISSIDETLPKGYLVENKAITFIPDNVDARFVQYEYSTTPKSHIIYGIKTKSPRELPTDSCFKHRKNLIKQTLDTLGDTSQLKITEVKNKWKIRESNQREITIDCEISISPEHRQLVMIYQDTTLSVLAFREWRKRQKEITLIRF